MCTVCPPQIGGQSRQRELKLVHRRSRLGPTSRQTSRVRLPTLLFRCERVERAIAQLQNGLPK